jgi:hypothetical protein
MSQKTVTDEFTGLKPYELRYIKILERRRSFLHNRLSSYRNTYDLTEFNALTWAMNYIRDSQQPRDA